MCIISERELLKYHFYFLCNLQLMNITIYTYNIIEQKP